MSLTYKPDWEETKERYRAWWNHEYFGRCGLWVTAPREDADEVSPPQSPDDRWHDLEFSDRSNEHYLSRTFFGAEAFPKWSTLHSRHKNISAFLGCPVTFAEDSVWLDPIWTGDRLDHQTLRLDEHNPDLQYALKEQRHVIERAGGRFFPEMSCNLSGCGDALEGLRGAERLLYDVMDRPDQVRKADLALMDIWIEVYSRFYTIVSGAAEGSSPCFPLWAPGKFYFTQCDFAYMLSPRQFRDLFLPSIEKQLDFLDYAIHHLDGEGNFKHGDALLECAKLQAIEVAPGAGKPNALHYMPLLKKIQAAGKNLWIALPPCEVENALANLSARGLFISTLCETEAEARDLIRGAEQWSVDR